MDRWICGHLADYRGLLGEGCIGIQDGVIAEVRKNPVGGRVVDYRGSGVIVAPGLIDIHVHLRGLEYSYKETEETGAWAAAASGITLVVDMPNTRPQARTLEVVNEKLDRLSRTPIDHSLFAGIPGSRSEAVKIAEAPIAGFKIYPQDLGPGEGLSTVLSLGRLVVLHPELPEAEEPVLEDPVAREAHRGCWLEAASVNIIQELSPISPVHVTHASCPSTVLAAKRAGYTVDATPHHLLYDTSRAEGCMFKVNPPIRGPGERSRLLYMVLEGVIDAFASDHAPHAQWEKSDPLYCSPGIPWLEAWPWILYRLVHAGALGIGEFHRLASRGPASILGLDDYGVIREGARANLVAYRHDARWRFPGPRHSKARSYTCMMEEARGLPLEVIVGGETVYKTGEPVEGHRGVNPFISKTRAGPV